MVLKSKLYFFVDLLDNFLLLDVLGLLGVGFFLVESNGKGEPLNVQFLSLSQDITMIDSNVRSTVDSPVSSPRVLDDPCIFAVDEVPSDDLDCVVSRELLVLGVNLIESFLVDEEIPVNWDSHHNRTILVDL